MKTSLAAYLNIFYLILLFTGTACKRLDGDTVVEGQLVDRDTGQAIRTKGKIVVFAARSGYSSGYSVKVEKETDANGKFAFSFETEEDCVLRGFTGLGYFTTWSDAAELKEGRNNKNLKVKMSAPAWVKFKLVNQPPLDTVPVVYISGFNTDMNGQQHINFYNLSQNVTIIKEISANETRGITWYFNRTGIVEPITEYFYFTALDTVEVIIPY